MSLPTKAKRKAQWWGGDPTRLGVPAQLCHMFNAHHPSKTKDRTCLPDLGIILQAAIMEDFFSPLFFCMRG